MRKNKLICVAILFCTVLTTFSQIQPLIISEVFYDTPLLENIFFGRIDSKQALASNNGEFIEIFNPTTNPVDLGNYSISARGENNIEKFFHFPKGKTIPARSTIIIVYRDKLDTEEFSIRYLFPKITAIQDRNSVIYHNSFRLNNTASRVSLYYRDNKNYELIDQVSYRFKKNPTDLKNPYWNLKAHNGYRNDDFFGHTLSLQRKDIHYGATQVYPLEKDYIVAKANPLEVSNNNLPILGEMYHGSSVNKNLSIGSLSGTGSVSPTGAAVYQIPINVPQGVNGVQPQISIVYNSQSGLGALGKGWDISGTSAITRSTPTLYYDAVSGKINTKIIEFDERDQLYIDGQRLILISGTHFADKAQYATEVEDWSRVELIKGSTTNYYFKKTTKEGMVYEYGSTASSKQGKSNRTKIHEILSWKLNKITDSYGNSLQYIYSSNGQYIERINYTGTTDYIKFIYANNTHSPRKTSLKGLTIVHDKILNSIEVYSQGKLFRKYEFAYNYANTDIRLESIVEKAGSNAAYALNATKIEWGPETVLEGPFLLEENKLNFENDAMPALFAADLNGDGYADIIEFTAGNKNNNPGGKIVAYPFNHITKKFEAKPIFTHNFGGDANQLPYKKMTVGDIDNDGKDDILLYHDGYLRVFRNITNNNYTYQEINLKNYGASLMYRERIPNFIIYDFNNDGCNDLLIYFRKRDGAGHQGQALYLEGSTGGNLKYIKTINLPFFESSGSFLVGNFNGDGKLDLRFILGEITTSNTPNKVNSYDLFNAAIEYMSPTISSRYARSYIAADFNGDGLTDFIHEKFQSFNSSRSSWVIEENLGNFFSMKARDLSFPNVEKVDRYENDAIHKDDADIIDRHMILPVDFDGDGLPDIVYIDDKYTTYKNVSGHLRLRYGGTNWHFYKNKGNFEFEKINLNVKTSLRTPKVNPVLIDIDGDGIKELVVVSGGKYYYFRMTGASKTNVVHKITNGLGQTEHFSYKNYWEYNQKDPVAPVYNLKAPMQIVDQHIDIAGNVNQYSFIDGIYHRTKGLLGFKKIEVENLTTNMLSSMEYELESTYYNLLAKKTTTRAKGSLVSLNEFENKIITVNSSKKRYIPTVTKQTTINYLDNTSTEVSSVFNTTGTLSKQTINLGNGLHTTEVTYSGYTKRTTAGLVSYLPGTVTQVVKRKDQPQIKTINKYTYDIGGNIATCYDNYQTTRQKLTEYTRNAKGVLIRQGFKYTYDDKPPLYTEYTYDSSNRYIIGIFDEINKSWIENTYDYYTGNLLTNTDLFRNEITKYQYDTWGKLIKTTLPTKESITHTYSWDDKEGVLFKKVTKSDKVSKQQTVYYDWLGREIITEEKNWNSLIVSSKNEYNAKGQLVKTIHPRYSSEKETYTSYEYDKYGRISNSTTYDGIKNLKTTYTYSGTKTTVKSPDGKTSTSTIDASGLVIQRTDNGGTIQYTYNSLGLPVKVVSNNVTTNVEYDEFGNQTKLYDPDAGTIKYTYYSDNLIKSHTNAKGDSTCYQYDELRRVTSEKTYVKKDNSISEIKYSYNDFTEYAPGGIKFVALYTNNKQVHKKTYTYNSKHLLTSTFDEYDGKKFTKSYTYDALNRRTKYKSPSNIEIDYQYDSYGELSAMKYGDKTLWKPASRNGKGQYTTVTLADGVNTYYDYLANGLIKSIRSTKDIYIQRLQYSYDELNYNLIERKDFINGINETFEYDRLDRLTVAKLNGKIEYEMSYNTKGNITEKTDVGKYLYTGPQPHAISGISGVPGNGISSDKQSLTYTHFNKVQKIRQDKDNYFIEYGVNRQRIKTIHTQNNKTKFTRYYIGNYEQETDAYGKTTNVDYIYTPTGLNYIIRTGAYATFNHVFTDNLGSISLIHDFKSNTAYNYAYTPWGCRIDLSGKTTSITDRGYTGHEHLLDFGLINMNGRMYDPVLARFLSPDPYVQAPEYTQSFNRYSYVWNNPFKYTDPSGEIVGSIIAGALIGGMVNLATRGISGNINSTGGFWGSFGFGALAGAVGGGISGAITAGAGVTTTMQGAIGTGVKAGALGSSASGFVLNAGNAWISGASFGEGLTTGLTGGVIGGITGGVVGAITSGLQFRKQKIAMNLFMEKNGINPNNPVPATDAYLNYFTKEWYISRGYDHFFQFIDEYTVENVPAGIAKKMAERPNSLAVTTAVKKNGKFTGRSSVYFSTKAFASARDLYFTIGHELIHVGQFAYLADFDVMNEDVLEAVLEPAAHGWNNKMKYYTGYKMKNPELYLEFYNMHPETALYLQNISNFSPYLPSFAPEFNKIPFNMNTLKDVLYLKK